MSNDQFADKDMLPPTSKWNSFSDIVKKFNEAQAFEDSLRYGTFKRQTFNMGQYRYQDSDGVMIIDRTMNVEVVPYDPPVYRFTQSQELELKAAQERVAKFHEDMRNQFREYHGQAKSKQDMTPQTPVTSAELFDALEHILGLDKKPVGDVELTIRMVRDKDAEIRLAYKEITKAHENDMDKWKYNEQDKKWYWQGEELGITLEQFKLVKVEEAEHF